MRSDVVNILLNGMEPARFVAMLLLAFAGAIVLFLSDVPNAIRNDPSSPDRFSFSYMLRTGAPRLIMGFIVVCVAILFFPEISRLVFAMPNPPPINGAIAFLIGIGADAIVKCIVTYGRRPAKYLFKK